MPRSKAEAAAYLGSICLDLRSIAIESELYLLAHRLELVCLEAAEIRVDARQQSSNSVSGASIASSEKIPVIDTGSITEEWQDGEKLKNDCSE
jgi:hypothetical protein